MAEPIWTNPLTFTAALVTVANLNTHVSQNEVYLHGPRGQYPVQVDVVNTLTETNVLSHTVNADDLGTNRLLRATLIGDFLNDTGLAANLTLFVKFGGTTLWQDTISVTSAAGRGDWTMVLLMGMCNSASSQFLTGSIVSTTRNATPAAGKGDLSDANGTIWANFGSNGTSAIATTSNQTLVVSAQWGIVSPNDSFRKHYALVELI